MDRRQHADRNGMRAENRQLMVAVVDQAMPHDARINLKVGAVKAVLDRNFSQARHTKLQAVFRRLHQNPRAGGNVLNALGDPNQQMRIQQQLHALPSNKDSISAAPIVLKSAGILICPAMNPNRLI